MVYGLRLALLLSRTVPIVGLMIHWLHLAAAIVGIMVCRLRLALFLPGMYSGIWLMADGLYLSFYFSQQRILQRIFQFRFM